MANYINKYIYIVKIISGRTLSITVGLLLFVFAGFQANAQSQEQIQLANEYALKGDKKKALELYREVARDVDDVSLFYNNYINLLIDMQLGDEAQAFLKKLSKRDPQNIQYKLDLGLVYMRSGDMGKADKHFKELIAENKNNVQRVKVISDYFLSHTLPDYGILALTESRQAMANPYLFCLDLAMLYRIKGNQDKMVQEYLSYVTQSSANIQYVKNVLQALLTKPDELESLERLLYDKVQQYPDVEVYADLLIWVTMQQKNFYASFIQARAYDKRYKREGEKCMEVARVALDNDDYDNATKIYRYLIKEYPNSQNYLLARLGLIRTREERVKKTFPVKTDSVRMLINDYRTFIKQYPDNLNSLEAAKSEAMLYATYLDQKDSAIHLLNRLIANPKASQFLKAKAKLELGDIYMLKGEPWESTLLYSQVEKTQKENVVGYDAKLRNAKLSYYKGDFRLAQEHLDILKQATTREIANDALELGMRIKENIAFDSTGAALKDYASVELLLYQNKTDEALARIEKLKTGVSDSGQTISNRTILDDVYWLEANIRMQRGEFDKSLSLLQKIITEYGEDILADDAYFLQGEIYERQLHNREKAMEIYREFLTKYAGSVYAAEARKRYRQLRGDFNPTPPAQPQ
ncbi:tetratricopeptide repeat protein [Chryseolinea sp. T2]|uniref:tetratricopeptide repeat protein n=1 Tax=Chryseolinea sp. T2 TaxID=3129255 RepID=UPI003076E4EE